MIKLDAGNVLLKPSHRRQLMAWLKRAVRLGERVGDFVLAVTIRRIGRLYEFRANVHDAAGDFWCKVRRSDWRNAAHEMIQSLTSQLHKQHLKLA